MKIATRYDVVKYKLELSEWEANCLMHICWFALDYKAEQDKVNNITMNDGETEIATKLRDFFENELKDNTKEL